MMCTFDKSLDNSLKDDFILLGCRSDYAPKKIFLSTTPIPIINLILPKRKVTNNGVLLLFTGEISGIITDPLFPTISSTIYFRISQVGYNGTQQISPMYTFISRSIVPTETFAYQFCDFTPYCCNNCIEYVVEAIPSIITNSESITLRNVVLSARTISCCGL